MQTQNHLKCFHCNELVNWDVEEVMHSNGTIHRKGTCPLCGATRLLAQERKRTDHIFYFGKHKGKNITQVPLDYLKWCLDKDVIGGGMAWAALEILQENGIKVDNYRLK